MTAAVALIIGIADFQWKVGNLLFNGIALGSVAAIVVYHVMCQIGIRRGTVSPVGTLPEPAQPATVAAGGKRGQARRRRP
jgi:hypothetical protein